MGFSSQPPLSSLGAQGGFVPGAPPTTAPSSWNVEQKPRAGEVASPVGTPYGFVSPLTASPVHTGSTPPVTMFNPSNVSGSGPAVSTLAVDQYGAPSSYPGGTATSPLPTPSFTPPVLMVPTSTSALPQQQIVAESNVPSMLSPSVVSATSLRGRERYCSGGAWVGPAPGWPKPPASATIENADTSRVAQNHRLIVDILKTKYQQAMQNAPAMRSKELEGISNKIGGMFVFLNNTGAIDSDSNNENTITSPVADVLSALVNYLSSGDVSSVNSALLYLSQNHWDEVSYWFPALKRLVKM